MRENYFADFNIYTHMAHFVSKHLSMRPNDLLDTWGVPELIVAYGQYANEIADENYRSWESGRKAKQQGWEPPQPKRYVVRFLGVKELDGP